MKIAALQMQAVAGGQEENLSRIGKAARKAADAGANLLIAPELALPGYGAGEEMQKLSAGVDGEAVARLAHISVEAGIAIIAGFAERAGSLVYNSAVFVNGQTRPVVYRKSHLYGDYERGCFVAEEPSTCLVEHEGLKIGVLICYDVEFPENVRRLAQAGAELIAVPTALPTSDHAGFIARQMIPVRAFENQVFVAYVNHCGADRLFSYAGRSTIAAPDGSLLAGAEAEGEALLVADIRPGDFAVSRAANPYLSDLRLPKARG